jgi:cobalt/nickel transport system permease protein
MLCRGYGKDSHIFIAKKPLQSSEWTFLSLCLVFVIAVPVIIWMGAGTLF